MVRRGVDALEFELGHGRYCGPAIEQYFETLSTRSHLRVIVVDEPGGKLFGIYEAPDLISSLRISGAEGYDRLAGLLNRSARLELARLPGFVAGSDAVSGGTSRRASEAESDERVSAKTRATGRWPLFLKDPRLRTWRGTIPSAPAGR